MKTVYPLKKAEPATIAQPLIKYLEHNDSPGSGMAMRDTLNQINQLRNKACALELPSNPTIEVVDKYIAIIEMYVRYARLIAKHFNWDSQYGSIVENFNITWCDSFNPQLKFSKPEIHFDIFCCFYNLGVLYFFKASLKCVQDFMNSKKQAIQFAKRSYYFFNQMRTVYYPGFVNTGFCDTNYPHLEMLECLSLGIVYKSMFEMFKQDQYKHGINKIASLAVLAQQNFYKAYQIGVQYFMKSSNISNNIKSELLSFAYVESLYHDVIANSKYAKHYQNEMDVSKDNIVLLIAYQRKALRLLNLGLTNENVVHLLDQRAQQKKDLLKIKPQLQGALNKNLMRNKQIYKKQEIAQQKMPPPFEPPKQYIVKASEPKQVSIEYQSKNAAPFAKLSDNQTKQLTTQLKQFSRNRLNGLQSAYSKLQKNVQTIYNDSYVNYYLNLENNNKNKGIPENLKKKIQQIQSNGGKAKLDIQVNIIKKNSELSAKSFQNLRKMLLEQQAMDNQKRQQYGQQWRRPPSSVVQASYRNNIDSYQGKAKQADQVNQKIIAKYENLQKQIKLSDSSQAEIFNSLPKVQVTKFIEQNKKDFEELKEGSDAVKAQMEGLDAIKQQLKALFTKIDYNKVGQSFIRNSQQGETKEALFQKLFGKAYKLIESFNQKGKTVQQNAKKVGQISSNLNKKNKGDEATKKQFEVIMGNYNDVNNLFRELVQGTSFYTKLNDILAKLDNDVEGLITARKFEAQQLEQSLGKKGGSGGFGGPNLPNMYPNQQPPQNFGFYVPPPMNFNQNQPMSNPYQQSGSQGGLGDMLKNLMSSKPTFDTNLFGGGSNVYQSKYK